MDAEATVEKQKESIPLIDPEAKKLAKRLTDDFDKHVSGEKDLSTILLKGHLLVENYLTHLVVLFFDTGVRVDRLSFFQKLQKLKESPHFELLKPYIVGALYSLNNVRNKLSHQLDFKIGESEIDEIGFHLGKEYVMKKMAENPTNYKEVLIWIINELTLWTYYPIYHLVLEERKPNKALPSPAPKISTPTSGSATTQNKTQ